MTVASGSTQKQYKPDFALMRGGVVRCIIDAKNTQEDPEDWIEQCSGYCLALNRMYEGGNPTRYFVVSNGVKTVCFEWDRETPLLELHFSDFVRGNVKYEHFRSIIGYDTITTSEASALQFQSADFRFERATTASARQLFNKCHNKIWKSEGYGPGPAFLAFIRLVFVKLYADRALRENAELQEKWGGGRRGYYVTS